VTLKDAARIHTVDRELVRSWELVKRAIDMDALQAEDFSEVINHLKDGRDFQTGDLAFEFVLDALTVRLHDLAEPVESALMIESMEALVDRMKSGTSPVEDRSNARG
jgi:hypothetical protein